MATLENVRLSYESNLPSLAGATGWLNSEPLTTTDLRGHVVVVDFWTFTCVNWIRTAPYRRAWDERYREHGLTVIGVHTPEFPFETDVDGIRAAIDERGIAYPVAVDSDRAIWNAFANRYWPALYVADAEGAIAFHHFGEGRYGESERVIQALLDETGGLVEVEAAGVEAAADWAALASPETYLGYERAERFSSPDLLTVTEPHPYTTPSRLRLNPWAPHTYTTPARLPLNHWALAGDWTIGRTAVRSDVAGGRLSFRFRARDVNLVMGPAEDREPIRFRVRLDGDPPGPARGIDIDDRGEGVAAIRRLYQLVRQPGEVVERTFEITFLERGAEAYVFTFG
jgi:thiol-disulfide isomerase/thioredoxin